MNVRPDAEEIDRRILDATAGLIARHGLRATSMQLVADAVGYSKAAIFHRYGSKDELCTRALGRCIDLGRDALDEVGDLPPGAVRDRAALVAMVDRGLRWPGFLALALSSVTVRERGELGEELTGLAESMLAMFSLEAPATANDPERLFRALGALGVVGVLGLNYADYVDPARARELIVDAAEATLR